MKSKYLIEIDGYINAFLEEGAKMRDMEIESFIAEILNRYAVDAHIMEGEEVKKGYEEMGEINVKLST